MTDWMDLVRSIWFRLRGFTESTLVVIVREAEPLKQLVAQPEETDLPAHVTVWYPFPRAALSRTWRRRLEASFAGEPQFETSLTAVHLFPDSASATPADPAPFRALSSTVQARFRVDHMYGGEFTQFVPHLTLGPRSQVTSERLNAVERALPFAFQVTGVELWGQRARRWEHIETFRLGPSTGT
ncbi:2'-5' RNA ligase family protein [Mycolicibacterium mucogenicum]|uniref:2'-5' RNA ligase family protein n=1 Tax=Mycolicibacterium mucogenicum TaxID=56689 RepID=UPI00226996BA|nr:2'-5' RNA ligase family protein [Mycolicibacterium mucogenicum]MCX8553824.1 2'-5' RNA ligase family protein [Mycolicibacterium mucogenicum]